MAEAGPSLLTSGTIILAAAGLFILMKPLRKLLKIILHIFSGLIALFLVNLASGFTGVSLAVNAVTLLTAGILGLPGVAALLILKLIFKIG